MIQPDNAAQQPADFSDISHYTYGTTRLGDSSLPFDARVRIARTAIDAGAWLHTSHTYGDALQVLRAAFDQSSPPAPPAIFKIGWESVAQVREIIGENLKPLGWARMPIGQLCLGGPLADAFRRNDPVCDELRGLKAEGLVRRFVMEIWPWNSDVAIDGLRTGAADGLIDGYIFYFNPLQRFASNVLWDLLRERNAPILAMRTVAGGSLDKMRAGGPAYLQKRAEEMAPIYERSGCHSWPEFCVRYVFGIPQVRTTVGATSQEGNLREFLEAARDPSPLSADIQAEIEALQRRWSDEHDAHAEPWSM